MSSSRKLVVIGAGAALLFVFLTVPYRRHVADFAQSSADVLRDRLGSSVSHGFVPDSVFADEQEAAPRPPSRPQSHERRPVVPAPSEDDEQLVLDDELSYRHHLEKEHGPYPYTSHSPTLGFSHIYVLSLPKRLDRRERMNKLAKALGLHITFVDATDKDAPIISWIGERAAEVRVKKRPILSEAYDLPLEHVGGMKIGSMWLHPSNIELASHSKTENPITGQPVDPPITIDFPSLAQDRFDGEDWITYLESHTASKLVPDDPNFNVTEAMWDPLEPNPYRQVNSAVHATWYSQTRVMELMRKNDDDSALVLEDDVDIEWDIGRVWPAIERRLPKKDGDEPPWQLAFLGHCWGREQTKATYMHPMLHPSTEPRCLHGYALSREGYTGILKYLRDPWLAYQTAIDTAIPNLIRSDMIAAFSVDPSIIIQSKDTPSDIQTGIGSPWRGLLADSTMERIWRDEGKEIPVLRWSDMKDDPASLTYRITSEKAAAERAAHRSDRMIQKAQNSAVAVAAHPELAPVVPAPRPRPARPPQVAAAADGREAPAPAPARNRNGAAAAGAGVGGGPRVARPRPPPRVIMDERGDEGLDEGQQRV